MHKKIFFIVTSGEIGGAQVFVKNQIVILNEAGYTTYLATNKEKWLIDNVRYIIRGSLTSNKIQKFSFTYLLDLIQFIRMNKIDLVICSSAYAGIYGRLASFFLGKNVVYVSHGWSSIYRGGKLKYFFNKIEFLLSTITNGIICVSENDYNVAFSNIGIQKNRLKLISNSIFPSVLKNTAIEKKTIKILAVSRLTFPKRPDLLVKAVKNLNNVHLTIVGDGDQRIMINEIISNEHILNVSLIGDKPGFNEFHNYDIFCLISESEGLPLSALEAMSSGLALVISNVGGCGELITNNGILVENNIESIESGILICIKNIYAFTRNSLYLFDKKFNLDKEKFNYYNYYETFF